MEVLEKFREKVESNLHQADRKKVKVAFAQINKEPLQSEAINLTLFSSSERRDLPMTYQNRVEKGGDEVIVRRPNLRLTLNVLLIFNFSRYENAIECYNQVIGLFYVSDFLQVEFDGQQVSVEVLASHFDDRNEIEIRNSFQLPAAPVLRYDLNYALIQGNATKEEALKGVKVNGKTLPPDDHFLPREVISKLLWPVEDLMQKIFQKENNLIYIWPEGIVDEPEAIKKRLDSLKESHQKAINFLSSLLEPPQILPVQSPAVEVLSKQLNECLKLLQQIPDGPPYEEFTPLLEECRTLRVAANKDFKQNLLQTHFYWQSIATIEQRIALFNEVGQSLYTGNIYKKKLTLEQEKIKWWELSGLLNNVRSAYEQEIKEKCGEEPTGPLLQLADEWTALSDQLNYPIEELEKLNEIYFDGLHPRRPGDDGKIVFVQAHYACNFKKDTPPLTPSEVPQYLQYVLIEFLKQLIIIN